MNMPDRAVCALVFNPAPEAGATLVRALRERGARASRAATWPEAVILAWRERPVVVTVPASCSDAFATRLLAEVRRALPGVVFVRTGADRVELDSAAASMGFRGSCEAGAPAGAVAQVVLGAGAGERLAARKCGDVVRLAVPARELSMRERQILELVCGGMGNREIARRLYLAETTVKWHLQAIGRALGVSGRVSIALEAVRLGVVRL